MNVCSENGNGSRGELPGGGSTGAFFQGLKTVLKKLRASQPFNCLATSLVRTGLRGTGMHSEWVVRHLHRVGLVRAKLPNDRVLSLWSRGDDWVSNQLYWRGWAGYEPETTPLFFRLAQRSRVTLDVGAYVGFYTLLAGHANAQGRVCAFEPMPAIYARLSRNVQLNRLSNVRCLASAVGDSDGTAPFYHIPGGMPTSSSLSFEFMQAAGAVSSLVPTVRLDRFVRDEGLRDVDLVKIDTESTEPQVLTGMADTLRRDRPAIICEVLKARGAERALEEILRPFGYCFYLLTAAGPMLQSRIEGHPQYLNYLFTTQDPEEVGRLWNDVVGQKPLGPANFHQNP